MLPESNNTSYIVSALTFQGITRIAQSSQSVDEKKKAMKAMHKAANGGKKFWTYSLSIFPCNKRLFIDLLISNSVQVISDLYRDAWHWILLVVEHNTRQ